MQTRETLFFFLSVYPKEPSVIGESLGRTMNKARKPFPFVYYYVRETFRCLVGCFDPDSTMWTSFCVSSFAGFQMDATKCFSFFLQFLIRFEKLEIFYESWIFLKTDFILIFGKKEKKKTLNQ